MSVTENCSTLRTAYLYACLHGYAQVREHMYKNQFTIPTADCQVNELALLQLNASSF